MNTAAHLSSSILFNFSNFSVPNSPFLVMMLKELAAPPVAPTAYLGRTGLCRLHQESFELPSAASSRRIKQQLQLCTYTSDFQHSCSNQPTYRLGSRRSLTQTDQSRVVEARTPPWILLAPCRFRADSVPTPTGYRHPVYPRRMNSSLFSDISLLLCHSLSVFFFLFAFSRFIILNFFKQDDEGPLEAR
ncbi:hypothetical protein N657DRAFT_250896 [Parathielavia appendiculata]|uniref:Transmembrane protein n=1 Tax=Parathielavia appendiculata TaxID=2587402 RepID=A0AAN6TS66_9PEZI|nr:hypothetical protein N657DRAFT_250896 [Parathielavia appendiculata]